MVETSEYFQVRVLHLSKNQMKIHNTNQQLAVYPPEDFKLYANYIVEKCSDDCLTVIAELLHQSDKHMSTFTDIPYKTPEGSSRTMMVETHIFLFHRTKNDGKYVFVPRKGIL